MLNLLNGIAATRHGVVAYRDVPAPAMVVGVRTKRIPPMPRCIRGYPCRPGAIVGPARRSGEGRRSAAKFRDRRASQVGRKLPDRCERSILPCSLVETMLALLSRRAHAGNPGFGVQAGRAVWKIAHFGRSILQDHVTIRGQ